MISAVIKAKNESAQIRECIASLDGFADEVVVVDDRSSDDTAALATAAGARVIAGESRDGVIDELDRVGFLAARGEWIIRMDADERMTPGLAQKLTEIARESAYAGVRYARKNMLFGKWARHGGWFKADQLRFFRADAWDHDWDCMLHSQPPVRGPVLTLPAEERLATIHYDYQSVPQFVRRSLKNYASAEARFLFKRGRRFSSIRMVFGPAKVFFGRYLIRRGFSDGMHGLVLAGLLAAYHFCVEAYLFDLQHRSIS